MSSAFLGLTQLPQNGYLVLQTFTFSALTTEDICGRVSSGMTVAVGPIQTAVKGFVSKTRGEIPS